ncbi:helix-turn-helix domain-containing protein [Peribacillus alkalitolerans]|uniref:helix-turn-helix domain-containing protein n=1 Tax=Peribacillus alkalitolerans TaxID=1550385 RepID=UPI0013D78761|nr:S24 family peptidase [Peribacillus alkalitolerans]
MIGENIKRYRKKAGLTQVMLAKNANISRSYLADVENNRYNMSLDVLSKIAKALNVDISVLLGEETDLTTLKYSKKDISQEILLTLQKITNDEGHFPPELKEKVFNIIVSTSLWMYTAYQNSYAAADYEKQFKAYFADPDEFTNWQIDEIENEFNEAYNYRTIKSVLAENSEDVLEEFLKSLEELIKTTGISQLTNGLIKVPVLGHIAAGQPLDRIEYIEGHELVESHMIRGREVYGLKVKGDSMIGDGIYDGDTVIVAQQSEVTSSDIAVVAVNGYEATLKRVKCEGDMCMLIPSNSVMQPILVPANKIHILGKVIQSRRNFE